MKKKHPVYHWNFIDLDGISLSDFLKHLLDLPWENILDPAYKDFKTSSSESTGRYIFQLISAADDELIAAIDADQFQNNNLHIHTRWRPDMTVFPDKIVKWLHENFTVTHCNFHPTR